MRRIPYNIDARDFIHPARSRKDEIITALLPYLVAAAVYLSCFDLGLWLAEFLMQSPFLNVLGSVLSFMLLTIAWIVAYFIFGIGMGDFSFPNRVFHLIEHADFRVSIAVIFFSFFLGVYMAKGIKTANLTYSSKLKSFCMLSAIVFTASIILRSIAGSLFENPGRFYFVLVSLGIIYVPLACCTAGRLLTFQNNQDAVRQRKDFLAGHDIAGMFEDFDDFNFN